MVETVPVVRRGRRVRVVYRGRGFTLETSARALGDGTIGEWIEIENQTSRKRLRALVLGPGTVLIDATHPVPGD
jgi:flagella basal body P-ring formation protein FlgA